MDLVPNRNYDKLVNNIRTCGYIFCENCLYIEENKFITSRDFITCQKCNKGIFCKFCIQSSNDGQCHFSNFKWHWICRKCLFNN